MDEASVARVLWAWQRADPRGEAGSGDRLRGRVQESRRDGRRDARARALAVHGAADRARVRRRACCAARARATRRSGRCAFCAVVEEEGRAGVRVVEEGARSIAFAPFASRFPFETWIVPRAHQARFEDAAEADIREPGGAAPVGAAADRPGAGPAGVQSGPAHRAVRRGGRGVGALAAGDPAEGDAAGRVRVGDRVFHQPDAARASGRGLA